MDGESLDDVRLAVSEAAANAVVHGSVGQDDARVGVAVELNDLEMLVTVSDTGNGFPPSVDTGGLGAGLPLIAAVSSRVDVRNSAAGTDVQLAFRRSGKVADSATGDQRLAQAARREREGALQHRDAALVEQDRLGDLLDGAVGTSSEFTAYARLQAAGEQVAARQGWVDWVETTSHGADNGAEHDSRAQSSMPSEPH